MTDYRTLDNIVIVGGGTAGWMAALFAQKALPESLITLIESEDIGILGAGEGTTPNFVTFSDFLGIPLTRFIDGADTTLKNGIKFTNWNNDGRHYYHGFDPVRDVGFGAFQTEDILPRTSLVLGLSSFEDSTLESVNVISKISEAGKVTFTRRTDLHKELELPNPIFQFEQHSYFGVHFNAAKVAKVLREVAEERGVHRVEGKVVGVSQAEDGDIQSLSLEDGTEISVDFLFDCTGFARKFIGEVYESEWKSHRDFLPVKRAIPFFVEHDGKHIPPYTEAIAMKYGWMWRIPTQERFGSGYVFDSDLVSDDEAKAELDEFMGFEVESPRTINFNAGYYTTPWVNNCIAAGLSSAFIEPLEATSLWTTVNTLAGALNNTELMRSKDPRIAEEFNRKFIDMHDQVVDFLYLHYMSKRDDSEFWMRFKDTSNAPGAIQELVETWQYRIPEYRDFQGKMFLFDSWMSVASGLELLNWNLIRKTMENTGAHKASAGALVELERRQKELIILCVDHSTFIKELKGRS